MSEKLYGAKCIRCGCIDHHGSEGLEADPIPWLEPRWLECARCTFCQERALSRAIQEAGLLIFAPEVREAVEMFKRGDTSHPITQSLRAECLAIEAEGDSGTPEAPECRDEIVHRCPPQGSGVMPCCGRTPFEVPPYHRMTLDVSEVSCHGE